MATLVLDRSDLELRADGSALALYQSGARSGTIPIALLDRVVLQGAAIRIETGVLTRLGEAGVTTLLLSARHSRRLALVLGPAHNEAAVRLAQCQMALDEDFCNDWSQRLVLAKTRAQAKLLRQAMLQRPDCRKPLTDALGTIDPIIRTLTESEDGVTARTRGLEGSAAAAYFRALCALFPEGLGFTGRNRRPPRDPVNAVLSLGYTLLHFDAVHASHIAGLDPLVGFYHRPAHGRESLACDLIEPLRPKLDAWVWNLFRGRVLRTEHFAHDRAACLLQKAGRTHFYQAYDEFAVPIRRWLRQQCAALARRLRGRGASWLDSPGDEEMF